jgi:hypothetical protein
MDIVHRLSESEYFSLLQKLVQQIVLQYHAQSYLLFMLLQAVY